MADLPEQLLIPSGIPTEEVQALAVCLAGLVEREVGAIMPTIAPALLLGHSSLKPYVALMSPPEGMGIVHESQSFRRDSVLSLDGPLTVKAGLTGTDPARVFDFALSDRDGTALGAMQTRLRLVTPEEMAKFKGSAFPAHMDKGDVVWIDSQPFDASTVERYLALARDPNPIHTSDDAAREVGLGKAVVPGMLFAGVIDFVLTDILPAITLDRLKLRFMAPVAVGEGLRYGVLIRGKDEGGIANILRVFVLRQDNIIAAIADLEVSPQDQAT